MQESDLFERRDRFSSGERSQLDRLLDRLQDVLKDDLIGAYLHGSAVLGGLRPRSDIDILLVCARATSRTQKQQVVDYLLGTSGRDSARNIELTIVVQSGVRPWRYPPPMDFQYGGWLRPYFEAGELEPWTSPNPDLASLLTMVLLGDWALLGPAPAEVLDPIPRHDFLDAVVKDIAPLLQNLDSDTRNVILTLARIWKAVATQAVDSKEGAANWALARLPAERRQVLARARSIYRGEEEDRWDDVRDQVRAYTDHVVSAIDQAVQSQGSC